LASCSDTLIVKYIGLRTQGTGSNAFNRMMAHNLKKYLKFISKTVKSGARALAFTFDRRMAIVLAKIGRSEALGIFGVNRTANPKNLLKRVELGKNQIILMPCATVTGVGNSFFILLL